MYLIILSDDIIQQSYKELLFVGPRKKDNKMSKKVETKVYKPRVIPQDEIEKHIERIESKMTVDEKIEILKQIGFKII